MNLKNLENIQQDSQSVSPGIMICKKCKQTFMFETECPSCNGKILEASERLVLAVRLKNITDNLNIADFFDSDLSKLKKLDDLLTPIIQIKKEKHGKELHSEFSALSSEVFETEKE